MSIGVAISITIGIVKLAGGGVVPPPDPTNSLTYYASDGTTLLLTTPITMTFTGTLYDQPIAFGG